MITVKPINEALALRENGYSVIPLCPNSKKPLIDWKVYQERTATLAQLYSWFGALSQNNIGVVCGEISGDLYVRDFDDIVLARQFYKEHREILKTIVRTRRGIHFYVHQTEGRNFQGDKQDGRGNGGYVVGAGSTVNGFEYEYVTPLVRPEELPDLPGVTLPSKPERINMGKMDAVPKHEVKDLQAYLSKVESVQGQRGSSGLVRAASICRDTGVSQMQAMLYLVVWNDGPTVRPSWEVRELRRAVTRVYGS